MSFEDLVEGLVLGFRWDPDTAVFEFISTVPEWGEVVPKYARTFAHAVCSGVTDFERTRWGPSARFHHAAGEFSHTDHRFQIVVHWVDLAESGDGSTVEISMGDLGNIVATYDKLTWTTIRAIGTETRPGEWEYRELSSGSPVDFDRPFG